MAAQECDPDSVLHAVRAFLGWREKQPALVTGAIRMLDAPEPVLAFVRGDDLLVVFNLSAAPVDWPLPDGVRATPLEAPGVTPGGLAGGSITLPPRAAFYGLLA